MKPDRRLDYQEARPAVRWWWHFIYSDHALRNWVLLFLALALMAASSFIYFVPLAG